MPESDLASLLAKVRACRHCAESLPYEPRPIVQAASHARMVIIGQVLIVAVVFDVLYRRATGERMT